MADTTEHAHEEKREYKNHGDPLEHTDDSTEPAPKHEPVPVPDNGSHAKSHAAHLGEHVDAHTKPASADLRHGMTPGERRQPPMVQSRNGK